VIPAFDDQGNLPPGIHRATWNELAAAFSGTPQRQRLVEGLYRAARALKTAGCSTLYVDGSFVTTKRKPADFDGCWEPSGVDPARLDPVLLEFADRRLAQKRQFGGELFPSTFRAEGAPPFRTFLDFFQCDKNTGARKGIIAIDLRSLP
jgi:hypothetical protein